MHRVVYDAGALVAADRNDRRFWAEHRSRLELGIVPVVPSTVIAQVSRSPKQAQLRRLLRGCEVVPLDEAAAHRVGALLAKSRTDDLVDASVVVEAIARDADVVSADAADMKRLVATARASVRVVRP
jgi:hypothetical protein